MINNYDNLLTSLPTNAPKIYQDLLNRRSGSFLEIKPKHTISLTLLGIAAVFFVLVLSIYLTSDRTRLEQNINVAALNYIAVTFSTVFMTLFGILGFARALFESLTIYAFDPEKVIVRSLLFSRNAVEINYNQIKHVFARGFIVRTLSLETNSNIHIVTNENRLYVLRSINQSQMLIQIVVKLAAESQNKSPRSIALTPDLDKYLTASGNIPPL